ncbi:hypothetical protein ACWD4B_06245 [Streptomyces sp. NPDC002536]
MRALNSGERAVLDMEWAYRRAVLERDTWRHRGTEYADCLPKYPDESHMAAQDLKELASQHAHKIKTAQIRVAARWAATASLTVQSLARDKVPDPFDVLYGHCVQDLEDALPFLIEIPKEQPESRNDFWPGNQAWTGARALKAAVALLTTDNDTNEPDSSKEVHAARELVRNPVPVLRTYAYACRHEAGQFAALRDYDPLEFAKASGFVPRDDSDDGGSGDNADGAAYAP